MNNITQEKALAIVNSPGFGLKNTMDVILTCRENHILTSLILICCENDKIKRQLAKDLRSCLRDAQTPKTITVEDELGRLLDKLLKSLFTRDPDNHDIMAIADGNPPGMDRLIKKDEFGNFILDGPISLDNN